MTKNVNAPENLRVKVSTFKSDLTFNEWAEKYNVSRSYVRHQPLFQGNPSAGIKPLVERSSPAKEFFENFMSTMIKLLKS